MKEIIPIGFKYANYSKNPANYTICEIFYKKYITMNMNHKIIKRVYKKSNTVLRRSIRLIKGSQGVDVIKGIILIMLFL